MKRITLGLIILAIAVSLGGLAFLLKNELPAYVESTCPQIYKMKFGATINKFLVLNDRLHLLVPLPITGQSGKIIEIDQIQKKGRKGR